MVTNVIAALAAALVSILGAQAIDPVKSALTCPPSLDAPLCKEHDYAFCSATQLQHHGRTYATQSYWPTRAHWVYRGGVQFYFDGVWAWDVLSCETFNGNQYCRKYLQRPSTYNGMVDYGFSSYDYNYIIPARGDANVTSICGHNLRNTTFCTVWSQVETTQSECSALNPAFREGGAFNFTAPEPNPPHTSGGSDRMQWVVIGSVAFLVLLLMFVALLCFVRYRKLSQLAKMRGVIQDTGGRSRASDKLHAFGGVDSADSAYDSGYTDGHGAVLLDDNGYAQL